MSTPAPVVNDIIQLYDKYGREVQVSRDKWRTEVLPASLRAHWDDADALYAAILQAMNDGFVAEVEDAIARLRDLEPQSARAAAAHGFVLLKAGSVDAARQVLEGHVTAHGREGTVLNNLAKVHAQRGDAAAVERTLWESLEADPNQENSLGWYEALHRERGGTAEAVAALERVAAMPRSWRARVSLARHALDARDGPRAMDLYREALAMLGSGTPTEVLMTITGDLGKRGLLAQLIEIGAPRFVAAEHGLPVGNNLMKAFVDSGRTAEARAILETLFAMNRPDWNATLSYWDREILKRETAGTVPPGATVQMVMYAIEGPVWCHPASPLASLFPPPAEGAPRVVFIGSSAETGNAPAQAQVQMSDAAGRLSRVLPLYLSEQAQFHAGAQVRSLFPWMDSKVGGSFVLTTVATSDADAVKRAIAGLACDFVVVTHVKAGPEPWSGTMRLLRVSDGRCLFAGEAFATADRPDVIAAQLALELQRRLAEHAQSRAQAPSAYLPPAPPHLASYLLRLEQLLAVRCARSASALHGVREIVEGPLHLCLDFPASVTTRALLADVVARMRNIRPDVVAEFRDRVLLLQEEHPLAEPAQSTLDAMLEAALDGRAVPG